MSKRKAPQTLLQTQTKTMRINTRITRSMTEARSIDARDDQDGSAVLEPNEEEQDDESDSEPSDAQLPGGGSVSTTRNNPGRTTWKNHLPVELYANIAENPIAQCFCGFFGADGVSATKRKVTSISVRSTDVPFLFNLLKLAGVQEPRVLVSKTRNAGKLGKVTWRMYNYELVKARARLGLPSSNIHNTDEEKARRFIFSLDLLGLLRFILFWAVDDGNIRFWRNETSLNELQYGSITISSRDVKVLQLMEEAFPKNRLPLSHGSSRLRFYDFIENNVNDKLLLVLAQDFHSLQLEAVNDLLAFTGFPKIRSIDEFRIVRFKENLLRLDESGVLQSIKKKIFAAYLKICRKRELPDSAGPPKNFDPEASYHLACDLCPGKEFSSMRQLKVHMFKEHPKEKIKCKNKKCTLTFESTSKMQEHYNNTRAGYPAIF
ncbi:hypothetical protein MUCCIDRAFT_112100 [Mucor lusitanicus CBS 277.49]|uniref:C2H2-type zinc finger transcription factor n=1 Tax=Mucor lusitanicus CBS 277.49 TaxID=747725 RepID=A0A162QC25_MUCCL|nr:hypothetical protein MUCCIDRAFT_112100 [Mucor lusitanicus CBS 277.49]